MPELFTKRVEVHIYNKSSFGQKYLVLKRSESGKYPGLWQMVSGTIEDGEKAYETALREVKEETALPIDVIYVLPRVTSYYNPDDDTMNLVPVFLARASSEDVQLSSEHSEYKWVHHNEAFSLLAWVQWKENVQYIEELLRNSTKFNALQKIENKY